MEFQFLKKSNEKRKKYDIMYSREKGNRNED